MSIQILKKTAVVMMMKCDGTAGKRMLPTCARAARWMAARAPGTVGRAGGIGNQCVRHIHSHTPPHTFNHFKLPTGARGRLNEPLLGSQDALRTLATTLGLAIPTLGYAYWTVQMHNPYEEDSRFYEEFQVLFEAWCKEEVPTWKLEEYLGRHKANKLGELSLERLMRRWDALNWKPSKDEVEEELFAALGKYCGLSQYVPGRFKASMDDFERSYGCIGGVPTSFDTC